MLTLEQLFGVLWRRRLIAITTFAAVVAAVAGVTFSMAKTYASTSYVLVVAGTGSGSDFEATQTNQVILKTYAELLQTRPVADEVAQQLPFDVDGAALGGMVSVSPVSQSQLIRITAESGDPVRAQQLANTYAEVFVDRARSLTREIGTTARIAVGERAVAVDDPVRPQPRLYLLGGAFLGGLLAAGVALLRDRLDQRLEIRADTTELLGIPVLARLPRQPRLSIENILSEASGPRGAMLIESFSFLLTNLAFVEEGRRPRSIVVLSAGEGEGKSTTSLGVAAAANAVGATVLVIDGDLRRPRLTNLFGDGNQTASGFAELLGGSPFPDPKALVLQQGNQGLHLLPAGATPSNPVGLLGAGLGRVERWARANFELVVYDTPPISVGADGSLIAAVADVALLVVDGKKTRRSHLLQAVDQLHRVHAPLVGIVLNREEHANQSSSRYYLDAQKKRASGNASNKR